MFMRAPETTPPDQGRDMTDSTQKPEIELPYFMRPDKALGVTKPEDDLLHPASFSNVSDASASETQYFAFNIPEQQINGFAYLWHHPNLHVCSGGIFVYQGSKETALHAELNDWRPYM